ncbi:beta-glucoside-specific PTS transporter subunit IIABC [Clostridium sp. E02]|uniref:beta-glucoside-specific PTS transporter subunit IIABC n=1 Tax=Clostridium sp. E02 TaxID=2487134 RepID=UPI000F531463|nr:beta-glucoside-specific PTS transporter subunit IIABC [Clostridium sp. E02]
MDYSTTVKLILTKVGGEKNVKSVTHCMTRLRFVLKDENIVKDDDVKNIKGVMGVIRSGGQYQIIIGNDVANCYKELTKLGNFASAENMTEMKEKRNIFIAILDAISGCMSPVIPAIIGAGMIKILIIILGYFVNGDSQTIQLLTIMGDSAFYFLPILLAFSAGKKFNTNPVLVATVAGVLLHPSFTAMFADVAKGVTFLGIPVVSTSYASTVIPIILTAWVMSYIEKLVEKITPVFTKNFLKPFLILLISAPVAFIILGPLGGIIGNGVSAVILAIQAKFSIVALIILSVGMPFLIMTGMHWAFVPTTLAALATAAGDSAFIPAMLLGNLAQGAASLAVAYKSKNSDLKQVASASGISALVAGITEPAMYGVTLRLKKPMLAACIASGITGAFVGFVKLAGHSFATPSLIALPIFISADNSNMLLYAIIASVIVIVLTFILTLVLGFDDPISESNKDTVETEYSINEKLGTIALESIKGIEITSPIEGKAIAITEVNDATFANEILGKGAAVIPEVGRIVAPFDGTVVCIFETKHALALRSRDGAEILIHVGLDTVKLNGKYFKAMVSDGQDIKQGDELLTFDIDGIKKEGYDIVTPVIVTNGDELGEVIALKGTKVRATETLIKIVHN